MSIGHTPVIYELGDGYKMESMRLGNIDNFFISHQEENIGHVRLLTDHVDVRCIIFENIQFDHINPLFSNHRASGMHFMRFLTGVEYRKFIFFVAVPPNITDVLAKTLFERKAHLIPENPFMSKSTPILAVKRMFSPTIELRSVVRQDQLWEVLALLKSNAYWQRYLTIETLTLLVQSSQCFIAMRDDAVIAFARVLTDEFTLGSLWDVVVDEKHRGIGIGSALMQHIFSYSRFSKIKNWALFTDTAKNLYAKFGFNPINQAFFNPSSSQFIILL